MPKFNIPLLDPEFDDTLFGAEQYDTPYMSIEDIEQEQFIEMYNDAEAA